MLKDLLVQVLATRFPDRGATFNLGPRKVAVFPAAHPAVGDVAIEADPTEATVLVGEIAHGHFDQWNSELPPDQVAQRILADVVEFLDALFADRVLLWASQDGRSGGWRQPFEGVTPTDIPLGAKTFVWSGPLPTVTSGSHAG